MAMTRAIDMIRNIKSLYNSLGRHGLFTDQIDMLVTHERLLRRLGEKSCNGEISEENYEEGEKRHLEGVQCVLDEFNKGKNREDRFFFYHQTDPRGCALYLILGADWDAAGKSVDSRYNTIGIAVCY